MGVPLTSHARGVSMSQDQSLDHRHMIWSSKVHLVGQYAFVWPFPLLGICNFNSITLTSHVRQGR